MGLGFWVGLYSSSNQLWAQNQVSSPEPTSQDPQIIQAEISAIRQQIQILLDRLVVLEEQLQDADVTPPPQNADVTQSSPVAEISRPLTPTAPPQLPAPELTATPEVTTTSEISSTPEVAVTPEISSTSVAAEVPIETLQPEETIEPIQPSVIQPITPTPQPTPTPDTRVSSEATQVIKVGTQTVSLPGDVLFDFDRAVIRPEAEGLLNEVADQLKSMSSARVIVEGHTDNIGDDDYNVGLSLRRANAVRDYLVQLIPEDDYLWSTEGYGASRPVADNQTAEGRQKNRRVDLTIVP